MKIHTKETRDKFYVPCAGKIVLDQWLDENGSGWLLFSSGLIVRLHDDEIIADEEATE